MFTCSHKCVHTWKCRHGVSVDQAWYMHHMYCQFKVIKCKLLFLVPSSHSVLFTCSHNVNMWWHPKLNFFFFLRILMRVCLLHCQQSPMHMYSRNSLAFITPILIQQCSQFSVFVDSVALLLSGPSLHAKSQCRSMCNACGGGGGIQWMLSLKEHYNGVLYSVCCSKLEHF